MRRMRFVALIAVVSFVLPASQPLSGTGAEPFRARQRLVLSAAAGGRLPDVPAFMRATAGHSGVVVPIVVAGSVVAMLYAEGPERQAGSSSPGSLWTEHVEVLVRHASSRLENVTSRRTVEVLTSSR